MTFTRTRIIQHLCVLTSLLHPFLNGSFPFLMKGSFCYLLAHPNPNSILLTMSPPSHLLLPPIQIHKTSSFTWSFSFARNTISVSTERPPPKPPPHVKQILHFGLPDLPSPSILKLVSASYPPSLPSLVRPPRKPPEEFRTTLKVVLLRGLRFNRLPPKPPWMLCWSAALSMGVWCYCFCVLFMLCCVSWFM